MGKELKKQDKKKQKKKQKTARPVASTKGPSGPGQAKEHVAEGGRKEKEEFEERGFIDTTPARVIESLHALWEEFPEETWYEKGAAYWEQTAADESGMLGGLEKEVKEPDEKSSRELLAMLQTSEFGMGRVRAADCGGGIGRVTKAVLSPYFDNVTLVEQNPRYATDLVPSGCNGTGTQCSRSLCYCPRTPLR